MSPQRQKLSLKSVYEHFTKTVHSSKAPVCRRQRELEHCNTGGSVTLRRSPAGNIKCNGGANNEGSTMTALFLEARKEFIS